MSDVKVVLNRKGVRDLLRSDEVRADLDRRAQAISVSAAAGGDPRHYLAETNLTSNRARASIVTATEEAMIDEAYKGTLSRALDAGR